MPGADLTPDDQILDWVKQAAETTYHPVGNRPPFPNTARSFRDGTQFFHPTPDEARFSPYEVLPVTAAEHAKTAPIQTRTLKIRDPR